MIVNEYKKLFKLFKLDVLINGTNCLFCTFENVSSSILGGVVYVLRFFLDTSRLEFN